MGHVPGLGLGLLAFLIGRVCLRILPCGREHHSITVHDIGCAATITSPFINEFIACEPSHDASKYTAGSGEVQYTYCSPAAVETARNIFDDFRAAHVN